MKISNLDKWVRDKECLPAMERGEIERLQLGRLNGLLSREKVRCGFYAGLPASLPRIEALCDLPFTKPEDLAEHGGGMVLISQSEIQRVLTETTSGTSGEVKRVFYTPGDCNNTVSFFAAGLSELVFPGSRTMICMPFSGPYGLGELISEAIESLGATPLKTGVGKTYGELCASLETQSPDTYVGMPAHLLAMLKYCGKGTLQRALVSGDACAGPVLDAIEKRLGTKLFPHYGSREMGLGGAVTCPAHEGMHLRENHVIAEIVDDNGNVLPRGEYGELVITTIGMEAMPLVRYRTGDYTRILKEPCPCGSRLLRLDSIERRAKGPDIVALDELLLDLDDVVDFKAEIQNCVLYIDALTLREPDERTIKAAAESALPGIDVRVSARRCEASDRPLYAGKRKIAGA
ncbi:MAG: phenylacetate--CoA ligase family protein [Clostridia bacterium]|nr:phenylacetate--CoA ligase family protein [Clostridia bacterium]